MSFQKYIRVICIALLMVLVFQPVLAVADLITSNGVFTQLFQNKGDEESTSSVRITEQESTYDEGWYYVTNGGGGYVRAVSVKVLDATPVPAPVTTTTVPTLKPGATATPEPLKGVTDTEYTGTIISYTVPQGGLMLFDAINGKQVESIKAGTKVNLTTVFESDGITVNHGWYSVYSNGKTYYVPSSVTNLSINSDPAATNQPLGSVASVVIGANDVTLYAKYSTTRVGNIYQYTLGNPTENKLRAGTRVNARYLSGTNQVLTYTIGSTIYYFYSAEIADNSQSSATVVGNDTAELMTAIVVDLETFGGRTLYREKSTSASSYSMSIDEHGKSITLYGVRVDTDWYKVMYKSEIFYLQIDKTMDKTAQMAVNNTTKTDTFWVTIGPDGGRLFLTRPKSTTTTAMKSETGYKKLSPGQNVLVSPYDSTWYIYTELTGANTVTNYYLYRPDLSEQTSTAAIVGGYKITLAKDVYLYDKTTASSPTANQLFAGATYVVQDVNDTWYSTVFNNLTYYIKKVDTKVGGGSSGAVKTFILSAGVSLTLYDNDASMGSLSIMGPETLTIWGATKNNRTDNPPNPPSLFYETIYKNKTYLIPIAQVQELEQSKTLASGSGSSVKLWHNSATCYGNLTCPDDDPPYTGTLVLRNATANHRSDVDASNYYETTVNGENYLVVKSETDGIGLGLGASSADLYDIDPEPIAIVSDGKDFYVTIGLAGAQLYVDSECTKPASTFLRPGEVVKARKYTDRLYLVSSSYLSVRDIASIRGGNDAAAGSPAIPDETIADVAKGQIDNTFKSTILSYTTPAGGLWLYYDIDAKRPAMILDGGKKIQLNMHADKDGDPILDGNGNSVYTIWYGGNQYFVPRAALSVDETKTVVGGTYSIVLDRSEPLFTTYTAYPTAQSTYLSGQTANILNAGTRVNVSIQLYTPTTTAALAAGFPAIKVPYVYRYTHIDGKVYYFWGYQTGQGSVSKTGETFAALVSSNADTNLISKLTVQANAYFYTTASDRSGYNVFDKNNEMTVYGVKYDQNWYKVMYNDKVYYINNAHVVQGTVEQVVIANNVTSTTYAVVIGTGGALLYKLPATGALKDKVNGIYENSELDGNGKPDKLPAGSSILASRVNSTWYVCSYNGKTLYFQNNGVTNTNTTASVSSYVITLEANKFIYLYTTISDTSQKTTLTLGDAVNSTTYTLRNINREWSSVVFNGKTYYVKNADVDAETRQKSIPIATTSIGNTYKITLGYPTDVFTDSKLSVKKGTLAAGTQLTGIKMYVDNATSADKQLVFKITFNGSASYINANMVTGVAEGDEVAEARLAAQEAANQGNTGAAVGAVVMHEMEVGSIIYEKMDLNSTTDVFRFKQTAQLTKVDASWYSLNYSGEKWYYPASKVELSSTGGTQVSVSVGETYNYTFTENTPLYKTADRYASIEEIILAAQKLTLPIKRISDDWYEVVYEGVKYYLPTSEVILPYIANGSTSTPSTSGSIQHDGTGYITPMLLISPDSGSVNMRKTASTTSTILARIPKGVQVKNNSYTVDASKNVWYNITYNGMTGYVLGDYVSPVGSVSTGSQPGNPANDMGKTLTVNTAEVNVRSGPASTYPIIGKVIKGTAIVPLDYKTDSDNMVWYGFKYTSTVTAYIRWDYLLGSAATSAEQSGNVAIKAGGTNLRTGPGESFSLVAKLARDVIVTIIGTGTDTQSNVWYRVTLDGQSGYVRSDLVRPLTASEQSGLIQSVISQYIELRSGDKGPEVLALQQQLIKLGYLSQGDADGSYGTKTVNAIKAFQKAKGMTQNGVASSGVQAALFNTASVPSGGTQSLDWFATGFTLISKNPNISVYDTLVGISWNAKYINGANHADVVPASKADADKVRAYNITGSYVRRPVIVNVAGQNYAGSMYAVGHGSTSYVSYFNGVMCIHFTGSKTHGTSTVDKDHQSAIQDALKYSTGQ